MRPQVQHVQLQRGNASLAHGTLHSGSVQLCFCLLSCAGMNDIVYFCTVAAAYVAAAAAAAAAAGA
jgi:hypothetical protein